MCPGKTNQPGPVAQADLSQGQFAQQGLDQWQVCSARTGSGRAPDPVFAGQTCHFAGFVMSQHIFIG